MCVCSYKHGEAFNYLCVFFSSTVYVVVIDSKMSIISRKAENHRCLQGFIIFCYLFPWKKINVINIEKQNDI